MSGDLWVWTWTHQAPHQCPDRTGLLGDQPTGVGGQLLFQALRQTDKLAAISEPASLIAPVESMDIIRRPEPESIAPRDDERVAKGQQQSVEAATLTGRYGGHPEGPVIMSAAQRRQTLPFAAHEPGHPDCQAEDQQPGRHSEFTRLR